MAIWFLHYIFGTRNTAKHSRIERLYPLSIRLPFCASRGVMCSLYTRHHHLSSTDRRTSAAPVQNMGVNHGSLYFLATKKLLHRPDVGAAFDKLRDEGMP